MNALDFTFSDLVAGYVTGYDQAADSFTLETSDGRPYEVGLTPNTYAEVIRNLGEGFKNASDQMREMLVPEVFEDPDDPQDDFVDADLVRARLEAGQPVLKL